MYQQCRTLFRFYPKFLIKQVGLHNSTKPKSPILGYVFLNPIFCLFTLNNKYTYPPCRIFIPVKPGFVLGTSWSLVVEKYSKSNTVILRYKCKKNFLSFFHL